MGSNPTRAIHQHVLAEQSGVLATLSRWRSGVQIPSGTHFITRRGTQSGKAAKLKPSWSVGSTPTRSAPIGPRAGGCWRSPTKGLRALVTSHPTSELLAAAAAFKACVGCGARCDVVVVVVVIVPLLFVVIEFC